MSEFQFLDNSHPDMVNVWRYDEEERTVDGIKTARTILASEIGAVASFGFFDDDVRAHLLSNYQRRLDKPSKTASGIGSPFISGMLQPNDVVGNWVKRRPDYTDSFLYRMVVPRSRVIVPVWGNDTSLPDWQKNSLEVLVVGDVDKDSIREIHSIK